MSSTNVHSEKRNNIQPVGGQNIPTENELEIPPKATGKGPSNFAVEYGEGMTINVEDSKINEKNVLEGDGIYLTLVNPRAFLDITRSKEHRTKVAPSKYGEAKKSKNSSSKRNNKSEVTDKGEDR